MEKKSVMGPLASPEEAVGIRLGAANGPKWWPSARDKAGRTRGNSAQSRITQFSTLFIVVPALIHMAY